MSSEVLSVVCHGPRDLRIEKRELKAPVKGEAQLAIAATGLCGTDAHYFVHGANGDFKIQAPMPLGHEASGIITAIGPDTPSHLKVGDRVAVEAGIFCKDCDFCRRGRYNLCKEMRFMGSAKTFPHLEGSIRERLNHPIELLHKLPDTCSYELAALAEPLSVVTHALRRSNLQAGQSVLITGCGAVGLLALSIAKAQGATARIAVDIDPGKLEFAKECGWATGGYALERGPRVSGVDALEAAKKGWEGLKATEAVTGTLGLEDGFDVVFECSGVESCMQLAVMAAKTGGKVLYVGMGTTALHLPTSVSLIREIDLIGVFRYCNTYPAALALLGSGQLGPVDKMVTQRYSLEDALTAFDDITKGKDAQGNMVVKIMVGQDVDKLYKK